jgi:hypothetical protein
MRKRIAAVLSTLVMAFGLAVATASPAMAETEVPDFSAAAFETDYVTDVDWYAADRKCNFPDVVYISGAVCVQPVGDDLWVQDKVANGYGIALFWWDEAAGREGVCIHDLGAAKSWAMCNKDFIDGHIITFSYANDTANGWNMDEATFRVVI